MSTRHTALQNAARWFDEGHFQAELARRVAYATASDAGGGTEPLAGYLSEAIQPGLQALGFECELLPNPAGGAGPLLVARRIEDPALPTVLTYGHGDVVNGQDSQWRAGLTPWTLTVEGDRWYGRGTADNKGQHTINLGALGHVIAARGGRLGYNVTVLLETGEEVGSPGLRELCEQERERLRADLLIACDGPRVHARQPTVFLGSRGIVNFRLRLRARERAYHSGNWGGLLRNPGTVLANAVACLVDAGFAPLQAATIFGLVGMLSIVGMLGAGGLVAACVQLKITSGGVFAVLGILILGAVLWLRIPERAPAAR